MKTLTVPLPQAAYPIHIGAGALESHLPPLVSRLARELVVVITAETLEKHYPQRVVELLAPTGLKVETHLLPDGEQHKNLDTLAGIYNRLMALQANRHTVLVAFGGGVVGDIAGFAAATFMRGIPVVQAPTTLLAQVDSSVGGKTAINHPRGKNAIGAFKQPAGVVIDPLLLRTLPRRELRAGLFELIKHGIIRDAELLAFLEAHQKELLNPTEVRFWEEAVYRSCAVKAEVVTLDEKETGLRAILNFGHSLGHLLETHAGYGTCLHGEAVGTGMIFAAYVSRELGHLSPAAYARLCALLEPLAAPISLPPLGEAEFSGLLLHDKKAAQGGLGFILLEEIGQAFVRKKTSPAELWPLFKSFLAEQPTLLQIKGEMALRREEGRAGAGT